MSKRDGSGQVTIKNPKDLVQSVQALQEENAKLKELDKLSTQLVQQITADLKVKSNLIKAFHCFVRKSTSTQRE